MRVIIEDVTDMRQSDVKATGNGAHVLVPVSWLGKTVKVFLISDIVEDDEK